MSTELDTLRYRPGNFLDTKKPHSSYRVWKVNY